MQGQQAESEWGHFMAFASTFLFILKKDVMSQRIKIEK